MFKRITAVLMVTVMLALCGAAQAQQSEKAAITRTEQEQFAQMWNDSLLPSLKGAWLVVADTFAGSYEKMRDDSMISQTWNEVGSKLALAGQAAGEYLGDMYSQACANASAAGVSLSEWLNAHSDDIESAARQAGEAMGNAMNTAGDALEQAGRAAGSFIDSLLGGK